MLPFGSVTFAITADTLALSLRFAVILTRLFSSKADPDVGMTFVTLGTSTSPTINVVVCVRLTLFLVSFVMIRR